MRQDSRIQTCFSGDSDLSSLVLLKYEVIQIGFRKNFDEVHYQYFVSTNLEMWRFRRKKRFTTRKSTA